MINRSEYEKISELIKKGDLDKLQEFIDLSYEKGNKKYLLEARDALITYLNYYPQSFIKYLDDTSSRENPLVESLFGMKPRSKKLIITDNVTGGFILNNDEIIDGSSTQKEHMLRKSGLSLSTGVTYTQNKNSEILIDKFKEISEAKKTNKLRLVSDEEITKREVCVYGKGYAHPHYFERTRFNSFKLLGDDIKLYVSSPKSIAMLYGESSKGKGFVLGLRK